MAIFFSYRGRLEFGQRNTFSGPLFTPRQVLSFVWRLEIWPSTAWQHRRPSKSALKGPACGIHSGILFFLPWTEMRFFLWCFPLQW